MANPKPQAPKVYQTYRFSTLGMALNDALDEMVASEEIPADVAKKVLSRFDSSISAGLTFANVRGKFSGTMKSYKSVEGVWTFILGDAEFETQDYSISAPLCKLVAVDGRDPTSSEANKRPGRPKGS